MKNMRALRGDLVGLGECDFDYDRIEVENGIATFVKGDAAPAPIEEEEEEEEGNDTESTVPKW